MCGFRRGGGGLEGLDYCSCCWKNVSPVYARKTQACTHGDRFIQSIGTLNVRARIRRMRTFTSRWYSLEVFSLTFGIVQRFLYNFEVTILSFSFTLVVCFRFLVTSAWFNCFNRRFSRKRVQSSMVFSRTHPAEFARSVGEMESGTSALRNVDEAV